MENKLETKFLVPVSFCDDTARMSIPQILSVFQDLAGEHGAALGVGMYDLGAKNLMWLTVRSKLQIVRRPHIYEEVTAKTWPEPPSKIRCNRYYTLSCGGEAVAFGKTEWAIINKQEGKLYPPAEVFSPDLVCLDEKVCDTPFVRVPEAFEENELLGKYIVRSTDIDVSCHMNNIAYIKAALGALSTKAIRDNNITEVDVVFRAQCFEGEELAIYLRTTDTGAQMGLIKPDGKAAFVMNLECGKPFIL